MGKDRSFGTPTAVQAQISFPSNLSTDANKISTIEIVGAAEVGLVGAVGQSVSSTFATLSEQNVQYITFSSRSSGTTGLSKLTGSAMSSLGTVFSFYARVPIAGWGSFSQMSSDTDTRVVAFSAWNTGASTTSVPTGSTATKLLNLTAGVDTHAAWNNSTQTYTIPVSGIYDVTVSAYTSNFAGSVSMGVIVNGLYGEIATIVQPSATTATGNRSFYFNAGQQVSLGTYHTSGSTQSYGGYNPTGLKIQRLSGPSVITATESVNARYFTTASQTIGTTDTIINFDNKSIDSHSSVTTGASWKFVAPVSGKYLASGFITLSSTSARYVYLYINGVLNSQISIGTGSSWEMTFSSTLVNLNAGDYLDFRAKVSPSATLTTTGTANYMNIIRVGN